MQESGSPSGPHGAAWCSATWQMQVLLDGDGYAEPPTRQQRRTRGHVMPPPASTVHDDDPVEPPARGGRAVTAIEAHGCPVAPVLGRNLGQQATLRDAGR